MTAAPLNMSTRTGPLSVRAGLAVAAACLALGFISTLELRHVSIAHGQPASWPLMLTVTMPKWLLLAATLPVILRIGVAWSTPRQRMRTIALHVGWFLLISGVHAAITSWSTALMSPMSYFFPWSARFMRAWYNTLPTIVSIYSAVLIAAWGMAEARERHRRTLRASQLEAQLQAARLEALRAKLQPHFLYNTLNGIAALVADVQPARAVAAIEQLSELLHVALRDDAAEQVSVDEEIALADKYLSLQRMRFGSRLQYDVDVSPEASPCMVPVLMLQPVVENAVVHGLDAGAEQLHIGISASVTDHELEIVVVNNSDVPESSGNVRTGAGVGLAASRARLLTTFGDRASLKLEKVPGGARVRITIPVIRRDRTIANGNQHPLALVR